MAEKAEYHGVVWSKGKKTILRPIEKADLEQLRRGINHPEIRQFLNSRIPITELFEQDWFEKISRDQNALTLAVCLHDGTLIGTMGIHKLDQLHRHGTTGAMIMQPEHQGKGYGQDAKMQLLAHTFLNLGMIKMYSEVLATNTRSLRYSERCGYREEGRLKRHIFRNGQYVDQVILAVHKEDWLPLWDEYQKDL